MRRPRHGHGPGIHVWLTTRWVRTEEDCSTSDAPSVRPQPKHYREHNREKQQLQNPFHQTRCIMKATQDHLHDIGDNFVANGLRHLRCLGILPTTEMPNGGGASGDKHRTPSRSHAATGDDAFGGRGRQKNRRVKQQYAHSPATFPPAKPATAAIAAEAARSAIPTTPSNNPSAYLYPSQLRHRRAHQIANDSRK